jgi:hypothetical protein
MIYSNQLNMVEPQRQEHTSRLIPSPDISSVTISKTSKMAFGSPITTVTLEAVCEETGKVVETIEFTQWSWEINSALIQKKKAEFAEKLRDQGYKVNLHNQKER